MPWQQLVADVGGELNPLTGLPAYRKVVVTVPRQSGKTTLLLAWFLQRCLGWDDYGPQVVTFTMQNGGAASKKVLDDWSPLLLRHKRQLRVSRVLRSNGNVGVNFANGSHLVVLPTTPDAGHGLTVDLGLTDELFNDRDDRREQSLLPAMATRPFAQNLVTSTAGDDLSEPLNRLVARGRAAVESGSTDGLAYFEWSAGLDEDPDDPSTWWACMPALGFTQTEDVTRQNRAITPDGEFRRAFLNQPTIVSDRVIPAASWDAVNVIDARPAIDVVFALDVNPERSAAAIAAASGGSVPVVEVVEHRPTTGWVIERVVALCEKWGGARMVIDGQGPAASMIPELQARGVRVTALTARDVTAACGAFYDRVVEGRVKVRRNIELDEAAAGVTKRPVGDAWAWARKHNTVDITPLTAVSFATWGAATPTNAGLIDPNEYEDD